MASLTVAIPPCNIQQQNPVFPFLGFMFVTGKADKGVDVSASTARKQVLQNSISKLAVLLKAKERQVKDLRKEEICKVLRQVLKKQDISF
jgi:hypothetical protein